MGVAWRLCCGNVRMVYEKKNCAQPGVLGTAKKQGVHLKFKFEKPVQNNEYKAS